MSDRYKLDEREAREIFERHIVPDIFGYSQAVETPKAVLFGGQPGAGKTRLVDRAEAGFEGDQFRSYHPMAGAIQKEHGKDTPIYTGADAGRWTEMAIDHAIQHRYSVAIEGTMRNPDTVRSTAVKLRAAGYDVEARAMAVPDLESWQGVHRRFERQAQENGVDAARFTPRTAHDAAYSGMLDTLGAIEREQLVERVSVHTRDDVEIYRSDRAGNTHASARHAVEAERSRPFAPKKAERHDRQWQGVQDQQEKRGASDTEQQSTAACRKHDRRELASRAGG